MTQECLNRRFAVPRSCLEAQLLASTAHVLRRLRQPLLQGGIATGLKLTGLVRCSQKRCYAFWFSPSATSQVH
jgi:hypothetical protein